jgi:hypothetical protein
MGCCTSKTKNGGKKTNMEQKPVLEVNDDGQECPDAQS